MTRARVVRIREPGEPEVLELGEHEVRAPGPGELRVLVAAERRDQSLPFPPDTLARTAAPRAPICSRLAL
ncbi:MAG: hypothetical protein MJD61_14685 [Proteobacteria bacterium]|nr:hypothetical protein [Pseudomonadota bacterium]